MSNVENDLNLAAGVGAAVGGPTGAAVAAGLAGAESVVNSVVAQAPHQTALTDVQNAVQAALPVIAAAPLPAADVAKATAGLSLMSQLIDFFKSIL